MGQLLSPETFEFFARYLLAGFVIYAVRGFYVLGERPKQTEIFFEVVVLSLINQVIWQLLRNAAFILPEPMQLERFPQARFFLEVLILPCLLGLLAGLALNKGGSAAIMRRLAMPIVQPTRRAYDHVFGELRQPAFVVVTYEEGTTVLGYFGPKSFAGRDVVNSDIYLERLYTIGEGVWVPTDPPRAALLKMTGVRSIEFLHPETKEVGNG